MPRRVTILGVPIDAVHASEALDRIRSYLREGKRHVATPNNEMLVQACSDEKFREVLNQTDLNIPDSTGLLFAAKLTGQKLPERVTGVDTVTNLCETLSGEHPVYLLGAGERVAEKAAAYLMKRNPKLLVVGTDPGNPGDVGIVDRINAAKPHLLLVAYGAPVQDFWIAEHLPQLETVRVAMGIGGTFDFLAGTVKRAPGFMRKAGLEWVWRLVTQPKRWRRIWNAVIIFPMLVMTSGAKPRQKNQVP